MFKRLIALFAALTLSLGVVVGVANASPTPKAVPPGTVASLLYFQDGHEIAPVDQKGNEHGGIARLSGVLNEARAEGVPTTTIFGGDLAGGTLFGAVYRGEAMVDGFNKVGVEVASFGNHDFDFGAEQARKLVGLSQFTWVNTNLTNTDGTPFLPTTSFIKEVGGIKVGYIGLTGAMANTAAADEVIETEPIAAAKKGVAELKANGAEVIVAINQYPNEVNQQLMAEVPEIDIALREENNYAQEGGDIEELADGRIIMSQEGNYGSVGRIDIIRDGVGFRFVASTLQVDQNAPVDPDLLKLQEKYVNDLEVKLAEEIACTSTGFVRTQQLGQIVAAGLKEKTGADLGWINAGGLRSDVDAGPITLKDAYAVLPFNNQAMKIEVTGAELRLGLEQAADSRPEGTGGGYPVVSGFTFKYDQNAAAGTKITELKLDNGTPIKDSDKFTLGITNYVVNGGNGVTAFKNSPILMDAGTVGADVDSLIAYVTKHYSCEVPEVEDPTAPVAPVVDPKPLKDPAKTPKVLPRTGN